MRSDHCHRDGVWTLDPSRELTGQLPRHGREERELDVLPAGEKLAGAGRGSHQRIAAWPLANSSPNAGDQSLALTGARPRPGAKQILQVLRPAKPQNGWMEAEISMGDRVRIIDTAETRQGGWAGLAGDCWGVTTPSITQVKVIGGPADQAFHIHFDSDSIADAWFHPDLVDYIDHAPGTEITVAGARLVREPTGEWRRMEADPSSPRDRRWWMPGARYRPKQH